MDKLLSNYPSLKMYLQKAIKMPLNPLCNFPEILHGKNLMVKSELSAIDYILRYQYIQEQSKQVGNVQPRVEWLQVFSHGLQSLEHSWITMIPTFLHISCQLFTLNCPEWIVFPEWQSNWVSNEQLELLLITGRMAFGPSSSL